MNIKFFLQEILGSSPHIQTNKIGGRRGGGGGWGKRRVEGRGTVKRT